MLSFGTPEVKRGKNLNEGKGTTCKGLCHRISRAINHLHLTENWTQTMWSYEGGCEVRKCDLWTEGTDEKERRTLELT